MNKDIKVLIAYNIPIKGNKKFEEQESSTTSDGFDIEASELSAIEEYEVIKEILTSQGLKAYSLNMMDDIDKLIQVLTNEQIDVVFNFVESVENDSTKEMYVAGLFELLKIPYTGCKPTTLGLCLNKHRAKLILRGAGFNVPNWRLYENPNKLLFNSPINFPVIVKPSREDASIGINKNSVVYDEIELKKQVEFLYEKFKQSILVEEFIDGREINSAIFGDKHKIALPLSEIDFSTLPEELPKIVTYDGKWIKESVYYKGTIPICPAPIDQELEVEIKNIALAATELFDCRDYCRVDLRIDKNNVPYILEINPNPDLSIDAGFARAAKVYGLNYDELLLRLIEFALERR